METVSLNMETIGQKLEQARRTKGVSIPEAGRATRILAKFIEAMESDNFGELSAPVYAKSFIRMYARYLDLEPQPLIDEYLEKHAPQIRPVLNDEMRQKLALTDQVTPDPLSIPENEQGFGTTTSSSKTSPSFMRWILPAIGVLALLWITFSVVQCASDEDEAPSPAVGGAALSDFQPLTDTLPDTYILPSGEIEVLLKPNNTP
jgi:cytoskeletal protein RodZ